MAAASSPYLLVSARPRRLCKQEVTGSIPVGSTRWRCHNDSPANLDLLRSDRSGTSEPRTHGRSRPSHGRLSRKRACDRWATRRSLHPSPSARVSVDGVPAQPGKRAPARDAGLATRSRGFSATLDSLVTRLEPPRVRSKSPSNRMAHRARPQAAIVGPCWSPAGADRSLSSCWPRIGVPQANARRARPADGAPTRTLTKGK